MAADNIFKYLHLIAQLGWMMISSILIGFAIGYGIDLKCHSSPIWTFIFLVIGIAAGFWSVYKVIAKRVGFK